MKIAAFLFLLALAELTSFAGEEGTKSWSDLIESDLGKFSVSVRPAQKKIEVKKVAGNEKSPPHLRVKILRGQDRPLELRLKTIERADAPLYYTGKTKMWNESYMGVEVEFSFDKKTWRKLGSVFRKVIP